MIVITIGKKNYEFYNVPQKILRAIVTLLKECANMETEIVDAESEG